MDIASRKFDRFRQKVNEKLGAQEVQTTTSDEFKQLEAEMNLRHEGRSFLFENDRRALADSLRDGETAESHDALRPGFVETQRSR
jgi:hypothetical protein